MQFQAFPGAICATLQAAPSNKMLVAATKLTAVNILRLNTRQLNILRAHDKEKYFYSMLQKCIFHGKILGLAHPIFQVLFLGFPGQMPFSETFQARKF